MLFLRLNGADNILIHTGDKVTVEYEGTLDDGTVFDSSELHKEPLSFIVGAGHVISGFDKAMSGMRIGDEKNVTLEPSEAYGKHDPELIHTLPKKQLSAELEPHLGMPLSVTLLNGQQMPAVIVEIEEETVRVDVNHPLAGKTLHFKLKVVGINV